MATTSTYSNGVLVTQFDYSKIFIWNGRFRQVTYTNPSGSQTVLPKGTLMGRVFATNKVLPNVSTATDGSQFPLGVLANDYTVAGSATVTLNVMVAGDVAREAIILGGADTFATIIKLNDSASATTNMGTIEDILWRNGILTVATSENTTPDN